MSLQLTVARTACDDSRLRGLLLRLPVAQATCINGKIIAEVMKVNASCFNALTDPTNQTLDGWIECFFVKAPANPMFS